MGVPGFQVPHTVLRSYPEMASTIVIDPERTGTGTTVVTVALNSLVQDRTEAEPVGREGVRRHPH